MWTKTRQWRRFVIAINNVNENEAMTKVVIAINGAECERKQGNDED